MKSIRIFVVFIYLAIQLFCCDIAFAGTGVVSAPPSWVQISTTTVSSPVTSVIFSSIPSTYNDLLLVVSGAATVGNVTIQPNSSTAYAVGFLCTLCFVSIDVIGYLKASPLMVFQANDSVQGDGTKTSVALKVSPITSLTFGDGASNITAGTFTLYGK